MVYQVAVAAALFLAAFPPACVALSPTPPPKSGGWDRSGVVSEGLLDAPPPAQLSPPRTGIARRSLFSSSAAAASFLALVTVDPEPSLAGIDPTALKSLQVEGDATGAAGRLRMIDAKKDDDVVERAWEDLKSGVSFRDYREGRGDTVIQPGSKVAVEMTIRCKSFSTATEPGGVKYFSTKDDTDFNELAFTVGNGELPPGLEEGMMGMRKGGLRRVELPSTMVFAARNAKQLPLPSTKNKDGTRRFESLFKTDATLLFEVLVTRIK